MTINYFWKNSQICPLPAKSKRCLHLIPLPPWSVLTVKEMEEYHSFKEIPWFWYYLLHPEGMFYHGSLLLSAWLAAVNSTFAQYTQYIIPVHPIVKQWDRWCCQLRDCFALLLGNWRIVKDKDHVIHGYFLICEPLVIPAVAIIIGDCPLSVHCLRTVGTKKFLE